MLDSLIAEANLRSSVQPEVSLTHLTSPWASCQRAGKCVSSVPLVYQTEAPLRCIAGVY